MGHHGLCACSLLLSIARAYHYTTVYLTDLYSETCLVRPLACETTSLESPHIPGSRATYLLV